MQQSVSDDYSSPPSNMSNRAPRDNSITDQRKETLLQQLAVARTVLSQAIDILDNHITSDDQLTVSSSYLPGSTIGAIHCGYLLDKKANA